MAFVSQEVIRKVWPRIKPFVEQDVSRGGYTCNICKYVSRDTGRMCAHFQSLHQDYIAVSALGDLFGE